MEFNGFLLTACAAFSGCSAPGSAQAEPEFSVALTTASAHVQQAAARALLETFFDGSEIAVPDELDNAVAGAGGNVARGEGVRLAAALPLWDDGQAWRITGDVALGYERDFITLADGIGVFTDPARVSLSVWSLWAGAQIHRSFGARNRVRGTLGAGGVFSHYAVRLRSAILDVSAEGQAGAAYAIAGLRHDLPWPGVDAWGTPAVSAQIRAYDTGAADLTVGLEVRF